MNTNVRFDASPFFIIFNLLTMRLLTSCLMLHPLLIQIVALLTRHTPALKLTLFFLALYAVCFMVSLNNASLLCFMDVINLYIAFILMRAQLRPTHTNTEMH